MLDRNFKNLPHSAKGYEIISRGEQIAKGYMPDVVLQKGNDYIIMECETNTTRKGYIGGMIKAARFLTLEKTGIEIIVLTEKSNTTVQQIYSHLMPYFEWIQPITNLRSVYVISTEAYSILNVPLEIFDESFKKQAKLISKHPINHI